MPSREEGEDLFQGAPERRLIDLIDARGKVTQMVKVRQELGVLGGDRGPGVCRRLGRRPGRSRGDRGVVRGGWRRAHNVEREQTPAVGAETSRLPRRDHGHVSRPEVVHRLAGEQLSS